MHLCACACRDHCNCHHPAPARGVSVTLSVSQRSTFTKPMMCKSTNHVAAGKLRLQSHMRSGSAPGDWLGFQPRFPVWAVSGWGWGRSGWVPAPLIETDPGPLGAQGECGRPGGPCPALRVWMLTLGLQWMMPSPSVCPSLVLA